MPGAGESYATKKFLVVTKALSVNKSYKFGISSIIMSISFISFLSSLSTDSSFTDEREVLLSVCGRALICFLYH